ncbi:hypothetical protein TanjilG_05552 [Lupinus angustifolius]|uniref:Dof zinc finger protein n=1 Tax=Lupinus angustifolius TaxID=3871 RepID=A0A1J7HCQ4_LUPAN|nr:PREDICTED: dof zinc finger protein DOF4.4-like [Lupinus angustifolius]OIW10404.1 hypothetical protein TanjilG_05552 [Lupinus angustifolius]
MEREVEQGRGGGEIGGDRNQQPQPPPPPQQQQQQCPRCESLNTKFCYYNNYSLSQPRFFCKACKRYWTQGGILRNIPIGGAARKRKRSKGSSSSSSTAMSSSSGQQPQLQPQPATQEVVQQLQNQPNMTTLVRPIPPRMVQSTNPYYQGGSIGSGYLSSLAAVHSLNPQPQPMNQSLNVGVGDVVASTNLGLLSSFHDRASLGLQHQHPDQIHAPRFYQIGNNRMVEPLLRQEHGFNVPPNMASNATAYGTDHWLQRFINNTNHRAPDTSLWSTVSTTFSISSNTRNNTRGGGSSSLMPNHWSNFPGNGSPYQ